MYIFKVWFKFISVWFDETSRAVAPWLLFSYGFFLYFTKLIRLIKYFSLKQTLLFKSNDYLCLCTMMNTLNYGPTLWAKYYVCEYFRCRNKGSAPLCPTPTADTELVTVCWLSALVLWGVGVQQAVHIGQMTVMIAVRQSPAIQTGGQWGFFFA